MSATAEIARFIELSDKLMAELYGDMWAARDKLSELEQDYIKQLRTVSRIVFDGQNLDVGCIKKKK